MTVCTDAPSRPTTAPRTAAIYSCRSCVGVPWRCVLVATLPVWVLSTSGV